jgi:hypothetical protein
MSSTHSTPSRRGTGEPAPPGTSQTGEPQETERLREDIAATRAELADTVEALAAKGDLKARAKDKVAEVKAAAGEQAGQAAQTTKVKAAQVGRQAQEKITEVTAKAKERAPMARRSGAAAAAVAAGLVLVWMWRRRARRNANPWQRAARTAKTQIKSVPGQAKAKAQLSTAKSKVKAAKVKAAKVKAKTLG